MSVAKKSLLLIIVVILLGIGIFRVIKLGLFVFSGCIGGCPVKEASKEDMSNYYLGTEKNKINYCKAIKDTKTRDDCYFNIANNKKDVSICDKSSTKEEIAYCYEFLASQTQDIAFCDRIREKYLNCPSPSIPCEPVSKETCYAIVAERKKDISICDKIIEDKNIKEDCYDKVKAQL
jgi:hypothetical protein